MKIKKALDSLQLWSARGYHRLNRFFLTEAGKRLQSWSGRLLTVAILSWLGWQLTQIGWQNIWQSLPDNPWFYIIFLLIFFSLPISEMFIYRLTWKFSLKKSFRVFLIKKVYNKDVLGYSGEVYFFVWAKKNIPLPGVEIFKTIKDNNVLSSVSSTLVAITLLLIFLFTDSIGLIELQRYRTELLAGVFGLVIVAAVVMMTRLRVYLISMPVKLAGLVFGMHTIRLLVVQFLQVVQWAVVLPDIALTVWITFIAIQIVLTRLPFVPNRDLIFLGITIELSAVMNLSAAAIAGLMVANSVLAKLMSFLFFSLSYVMKDRLPDAAEMPDRETG